jgi:hypothetical protein
MYSVVFHFKVDRVDKNELNVVIFISSGPLIALIKQDIELQSCNVELALYSHLLHGLSIHFNIMMYQSEFSFYINLRISL